MEALTGLISMVLIVSIIVMAMAVIVYYLHRLVRSNTLRLSDGYLFTCSGRNPIYVNNMTDARILAMESDMYGIRYTVYPIEKGLLGKPFQSDLFF